MFSCEIAPNRKILISVFQELSASSNKTTLHILTAISFAFFQRSERNTLTFLSLCISQVLMEKIFCFELRHYTHLIKLALLQLHYRASLTKFKTLHHYIIIITRAPTWYYITLTFHHTLQCLSIYRFNQIFNFHICHSLLFHSLKSMSHIPSPITYGTLRNYYFFLVTSRLIQDHNKLIKTQSCPPYAPTKLPEEFSKIQHQDTGPLNQEISGAKSTLEFWEDAIETVIQLIID